MKIFRSIYFFPVVTLVGFSIFLFVGVAYGSIANPDSTNNSKSGEPTASPVTFKLGAPVFDSMLISEGDYQVVSSGDLVVDGNLLRVEGTIKTDNLEGYGGSIIKINGDLEAPNFGTFYKVSSTCSSCVTTYIGAQAGMYRNYLSCDAGDVLINCNAYVGDMTKKIYGTDVYQYNGTWSCTGLASGSPITTEAVCFSSDATINTAMNDIVN